MQHATPSPEAKNSALAIECGARIVRTSMAGNFVTAYALAKAITAATAIEKSARDLREALEAMR